MSAECKVPILVASPAPGESRLFPVFSLGHSVLIPALVGGSWAQDLSVSRPESSYLAFIVGLHAATAAAMIIYFRHDWARIVSGFVPRCGTGPSPRPSRSWPVRARARAPVPGRVQQACPDRAVPDSQRGDPAGRGARAAPIRRARHGTTARHGRTGRFAARDDRGRLPGSAVQEVPGLAAGRPAATPVQQLAASPETVADRRLATMGYGKAIVIGAVQVFALLPGISRDGIVTVTGMFRGLSREDAVRSSFLLSAPVILAAGVLKIPDLFGPLGAGIHGQVLAGSLMAGLGAYFSVRFLVRYFSKARSLARFAIYCLIAGLGSLVWFAIR